MYVSHAWFLNYGLYIWKRTLSRTLNSPQLTTDGDDNDGDGGDGVPTAPHDTNAFPYNL